MLWGQEGMRGHTVVYRMCFSGEEADKASNGGNANTGRHQNRGCAAARQRTIHRRRQPHQHQQRGQNETGNKTTAGLLVPT